MIFSGTHGPEGWPGHSADPRPQPQATAYCLVGRIGNGPWFEAGRFWQGKAPSGNAGRLLLNINDNNPYNGNPSDRWTVHVEVQRANAAAAGLYV